MEVALKGRHRFDEVARGRHSGPAPTKAAQRGSAPARCRSSSPAGPRTEAGTEGADGGGALACRVLTPAGRPGNARRCAGPRSNPFRGEGPACPEG